MPDTPLKKTRRSVSKLRLYKEVVKLIDEQDIDTSMALAIFVDILKDEILGELLEDA